jgi:hypothetical protein
MADLLPGSYDLFGQKPGYAPRFKGSVVVAANQSTTADFKLEWADPSTGAIEVVAVDPKGNLLPDTTVDVTQFSTLITRSDTDESGTVVFPGLAPATYTLTATRPGYRDPAGRNVRVRAAISTKVTLTLKRDTSEVGRLAGIVRNLEGAVVANARVKIIDGLSSGEVRTNGSGRYEFVNLIPDTNYAIQVSAGGFATQTIGGLVVDALQLTLRDVMLLPNAPTLGSLSGTISDPQGDPIPFAVVSITAGPGLGLQAIAGEDGLYLFTELEPSPDYGILAEAPGYSDAGRGSIRITAGQTALVDVQLSNQTTPPGAIAGTVRDDDGGNLSGVVVTLMNGPSVGLTTTTDGIGEYRLSGVRPFEAYTVRFTKSGYLTATQPFIQVNSGVTSNLVAQLSPLVVSVGHISGTVTNEAAAPLKNVRVELFAGPNAPLTTTTNASGVFNFRNLRPGTGNSLRFIRENFVTATRTNVTVSDGQTSRVNITLNRVEQTGHLAGRVTDLLGRGIANALVLVLDGPELPLPVRADSTGRFRFEGIKSGSYDLEAVANGYANGRKNNVIVSAGGTTNVTIQLLRP